MNLIKQGPSWKLRRRAVFGSLLFSMAIILYVAVRWDSTSLAETLVLGAFGLMGAIVAAYIGGAVYEDTRLPQHIQQNKTMRVNNHDEYIEDYDEPGFYEEDYTEIGEKNVY